MRTPRAGARHHPQRRNRREVQVSSCSADDAQQRYWLARTVSHGSLTSSFMAVACLRAFRLTRLASQLALDRRAEDSPTSTAGSRCSPINALERNGQFHDLAVVDKLPLADSQRLALASAVRIRRPRRRGAMLAFSVTAMRGLHLVPIDDLTAATEVQAPSLYAASAASDNLVTPSRRSLCRGTRRLLRPRARRAAHCLPRGAAGLRW
jgi:hypothetical protein